MEPAREVYWQGRWAEARLSLARRIPGREKFYALVAYPGPSGFLHLGHLRGMLLADALHRHQRMLGRQVFFPTGTHASGLPAVTFAQRVRDRDPIIVQQLRDNEISESEWTSLEDPVQAADFLGESYLALYRRLGILVDETAYLSTVDPDYQAFIRWQFHRLERAGALRQGTHYSAVCPVCGPVSVDPSETDLSSGGEAETIVYTLVPFQLEDGRVLLTATLRPETIYGVTNLWIAPDVPLTVWHLGEREFLVSEAGARRLVEQHGGRVGAKHEVESLVGRKVRGPVAGQPVPILPSALVDPSVGTGVVMSVPAHAPADWLALTELAAAEQASIGTPPVIIEIPSSAELTASERELLAGSSGPPAERACKACGATSLRAREELEAATERLYRVELLRGRMRADILDGAPVALARTQTSATLAAEPGSGELRQFSVLVVCRNGHEVSIRRIPDQWFLAYSDPNWKTETKSAVASMAIQPGEYARELPSIIDWFQDRPATRRGRWLGTPFPLDPTWIIEPIADSTLYPAYFVIRRFVRDGRLSAEQLTDPFFDRVVLGEGDGEPSVSRELQEEIRAEFTYWYPLDLNIGGKEHKRVHFPVFLFTHSRLLPSSMAPRGIFVHWWLTRPGGGKISKKEVTSKGGAIPPIREALGRWGADTLRLFFYQAASPQQDIEWEEDLVDRANDRLTEVDRMAREALLDGSGATAELEEWLASAMHTAIADVRAALDERAVRVAVEIVYGRIPALLKRFRLRGGDSGPAVQKVRDAWIRLLLPFTPHLAEELGADSKNGLVSLRSFPSPEEFLHSSGAEVAEAYLERAEEDLRDVLRPAQGRAEVADGVAFFVAAPWKREVEGWLRAWVAEGAHGAPIGAIMQRAQQHPELAAHLSEIPRYVQRVAPLIRQEPTALPLPSDEGAVLRSAEGYLARRFEFRVVSVLDERSPGESDPLGRRERARPGHPAFYLFARHATSR